MAVAVIASLASFLLGMITVRMAGLRHEVIGGLLGLSWFWGTFIWLMQNKRREIEAIKKELERMYRRLNFQASSHSCIEKAHARAARGLSLSLPMGSEGSRD